MRFLTFATNSRKKIASVGGGAQGQTVRVNGWTEGVKVVSQPRYGKQHEKQFGKVDQFHIYMTSGSNNQEPQQYLGTVRRSETDGSLQFFTDEAP